MSTCHRGARLFRPQFRDQFFKSSTARSHSPPKKSKTRPDTKSYQNIFSLDIFFDMKSNYLAINIEINCMLQPLD